MIVFIFKIYQINFQIKSLNNIFKNTKNDRRINRVYNVRKYSLRDRYEIYMRKSKINKSRLKK